MVTTPTVWLDSFRANLDPADSQSDPVVVGLSNGNFLVVWTDTNDTVAPGVGSDIVGVIYDALGNAISGSLFLNNGFGFSRSESDPVIAATNDGGFVLVYEFASGSDTDLIYGRYDSLGGRTQSGYIVNDLSSTTTYRDPSVAVASDNSFFVTYEADDGTTQEIRGKKVDATGVVGSEQVLRVDAGDGNPFDPDTVVLNDDRFVTAFRERDPFGGVDEYSIEVRISNADGTNGANLQVALSDGAADSDPHVAALADGGFIVTWVEGNDLRGRIYESNLIGGAEFDITNTANNDNEPDVIGLEDGTIFVVWDIDTAPARLAGVRLDANGNQLGASMIIANDTDQTGGIVNPELGLTSDGRILVSWQHGSEIFTKILDPREPLINVEAGDGVTTGRQDGSTIIGTGGDDVVFGVDGNDTISVGNGNDTVDAGNGDDTVQGGFGNDDLDGGFGNDTVDYSYSQPAPLSLAATRTINLATGTSFFDPIIGPNSDIDTLSGFENVIGSGWNDIITGTSGNNTLDGEDGNDTIFGGAGVDTINGGDGDDTIEGGFSTDEINGGAGADTFIIRNGEFSDNINGGSGTDTLDLSNRNDLAASIDLLAGTYDLQGPQNTIVSVETIIGTQLNDTIASTFGTQTLRGEGGNDTFINGDGQFIDDIDGGSGADFLDLSAVVGAGEDVDIDMQAGTWSGLGGTRTITSIERVTGTQEGDVIRGQAGAQTLNGGGGDDTIEGGAGGDLLDGGLGFDTLSYESSNAGVNVDIRNNVVSGGHATGDTISNFESVIGSAFDDVLRGIGDGLLSGGSGNDTFDFRFGDGTPDFAGGGGVDTADFSTFVGTAILADLAAGNYDFGNNGSVDGLLTSVENYIGGTGNEVVVGSAAANKIDGGDGNDTISGGAGIDILIGGSGNDVLDGGAQSDVLDGGDGDDTLNGGTGVDTVDGGAGIDTLDVSGATNTQKMNLVTNVNIGGFVNNDTFLNIENVIGSATNGDDITGTAGANVLSGLGADDLLRGFNGDDTLLGGDGNDFLFGGNGADAMDGGAGLDWAMYNGLTVGVTVNLSTGVGSGGQAAGDTYTSIERVRGSLSDDVITGDNNSNKVLGDDGNDTIFGLGGQDSLRGGNGNDLISGGSGNDSMFGDAGSDTFVLALGSDADFAADFENDIDTLQLDDALWGGGLTAQQVVDTFGVQVNPNRIDLVFGTDILKVQSAAAISFADLYDDVSIV